MCKTTKETDTYHPATQAPISYSKNDEPNFYISKVKKFCSELMWPNVILLTYMHIAGLYGYWLFSTSINPSAFIIIIVQGWFIGLGITMGAHRLWAHRSFKATWQLRLILALFQTMSIQKSIYSWCRDHRVHHKYSETDADPHNAKRGFFFSHMGWILLKKHPDVIKRGKELDMSDLSSDPIVAFQHKYYWILVPIVSFALPISFLMNISKFDFWSAWYLVAFLWIYTLHATWTVNSFAHLWGSKPYDKGINPSENLFVSAMSYGEGFHNYHHAFPYDYKASELGDIFYNPTTKVIDIFAKIGWAYNLKTVSQEAVNRRVLRTGDGSHEKFSDNVISDDNYHESNIWGWGDDNLREEDYKAVTVFNKKTE